MLFRDNFNRMRKKIENVLFSYTDGVGLELFRRLFALILFYQSYSFYSVKYLEAGILAPSYLFCFQQHKNFFY